MTTREKQIENCLVGLAMVEELKGRFTTELSDWANDNMRNHGPTHCGSAACFGGWVAVHPHFQRQGVFPGDGGAPATRDPWDNSHSIARRLFGVPGMFDIMVESGSAYKEVKHRLYGALDYLLSTDCV